MKNKINIEGIKLYAFHGCLEEEAKIGANYIVDVNITTDFSKDGSSREFNNLVIAEVKQNKASASEFTKLMRELRVKQGGMSKYCIGVSNLVNAVKKNNFKEKNNKINKLNKI
jgi:hypothetical protein